ncbi:MAG: hypothetical protein ACLPVY_12235 [Acidimicrobiia bacterium]
MDTAHPRYDAALERSGREFAELLEALAECNQSRARLIRARVARRWTNDEHSAYLRLRRTKAELNTRIQQVQRTFERARSSERDLGLPG